MYCILGLTVPTSLQRQLVSAALCKGFVLSYLHRKQTTQNLHIHTHLSVSRAKIYINGKGYCTTIFTCVWGIRRQPPSSYIVQIYRNGFPGPCDEAVELIVVDVKLLCEYGEAPTEFEVGSVEDFCSCNSKDGFFIFTRLLISCRRDCMIESRCFTELYR